MQARAPGATVWAVIWTMWLVNAAGLPAKTAVDRELDWWQWGGPSRDFTVRAPALRGTWEEASPVELFRRPLDGGHSAVGYAADRVLVVHGRGGRESVAALGIDGETLWQRQHAVGYTASVASHDGPHAAPLAVGELVITVSIDATVRAHRLADGEPVWRRDLRREHGVTLPQAGYAASPLLVGDTLLLPGLGRAGTGFRRFEEPGLGVLALAVRSGETVWQSESFPASHASPVLLELDDERLAVFHGTELLVAVRAHSGEPVWRFPLRRGAADNVSFTPLWDPEARLLVLSHAYDPRGAQAIRLGRAGRSPQRVWSSSRLKVEHGNGLLVDGMLLASDGSEPGFLVALDAGTGELLWKERRPKSTFVEVLNQMVLMLDARGTLSLARPDRVGSGVVSQLEVLSGTAWTAPTLVGRILLLRDADTLVALRLP